jgi:hypothetical protein
MSIEENIHRLSALSVLIMAFTATSIAQGFGAFPFEQEKKISGIEADFSIGLINLDNVTREVKLGVESSENYNITFHQNPVKLDSSVITSNPVDDRQWYGIGNGRYAEIREITFSVSISRDSDAKHLSIPVKVDAVYSNRESSEVSQKVIQSRVHTFQLSTTSQMVESVDEEFFSDGSLLNATAKETSSEQKSNTSEDLNQQSQNISNEGTISEPEKGLTDQNKDLDEAVDRWTILFLLGTLVSVVIIAKELP